MPGKLQKFANKAAFYFYLRMQRDNIIMGFRKWVEDYGLEQMKETITKGEFPDIAPDLFSQAGEYIEYLETISDEYLVELLSEAAPDILQHIVSMGPSGGVYLIKLRLHFLDLCRHPDKAPVVDTPLPSGDGEVVMIDCDQCKKKFPLKKADFPKLKSCPLCGAPANK